MREEGGRLVLMDFGAGVDSAELTNGTSRKYAGTPLYTAPELFNGRRPTPQSDLYSLGVMLYHLVTSAYPLEGDSPTKMHAAHQKGERKRLRDLRPDLPAEFVRIVERAMDPDPERRYQSAGELEADLGQFVVVADRPAAAAARPAPYRRWWIAAGALAVFIL